MADREVSMFQIHGYIASSGQGAGGSYKADHVIQTIWETVNCNKNNNNNKNNDNSAAESLTTASSNRNNEGTGSSTSRKKDRQCRVYVTDYTTFWRGTLTRKDWEAQRHSRCEGVVNENLYENLTKDAFKGVPKKVDDKWALTLSIRSSTLNSDDLETILGTMTLEKIAPEESKKILQQWVKTMIEERQKFEHLSDSLKDHVVKLDHQYKECKDLLADFKLDKRRSQSDLMEKFRMLINTKKEKITKLTKFSKSLQERVEKLENALKEERKKVAALENKKVDNNDVDLVEIKEQEDSEDEDSKSTPNTRGAGHGRGRGKGRGRGRGKASPADKETDDHADNGGMNSSQRSKAGSSSGPGLRIKRLKQEAKDVNNNSIDQDDMEPPPPLAHPQDTYGWDEDDSAGRITLGGGEDNDDDEEDEPLVRYSSRHTAKVLPSTPSSSLSKSSVTNQQEVKKLNLEDLSAGAQKLIQRVSKAANYGVYKTRAHPKEDKSGINVLRSSTASSTSATAQRSTPPPPQKKRTLIKREGSDDVEMNLRCAPDQSESDNTDLNSDKRDNSFFDVDGISPRKRLRAHSGDGSSNSDMVHSESSKGVLKARKGDTTSPPEATSSTRSRSRLPVVSMRKAGTSKAVVEKGSLDATPPSPLRSFLSVESSSPTAEPKVTRTTSSSDVSKRSTGNPKEGPTPSIISEEDLYKELE
ncbi:hypothetical protein BGZ65_003193 [Modicella reniformis]|uniref:XRCC4 n=1 Tax=Modicella reniformis TaxID=1440133 RepID=A0A9P6SPQ2_9FUNG|nr:hypothetical protein BGZ65_003193 [Modicella reniformis]